MSVRHKTSVLCVLGLALLLGGCGGESAVSYGPETDDPGYREGQQLAKQGRTQEALAAYLKVIEKRGEQGSAESHLEVGLILKQHIKDPLEAIHHFRKYLEQQPNAPLAAKVRGQMEDAKREFARTLPGQPMESQATRMEGYELLAQLQRENDLLKAELAAAQRGNESARPTNTVRVSLNESVETKGAPPPAVAVEEASPITLAPLGQREIVEAPPTIQSAPPPAAATPKTTAPRPTASKPTATGAGRRHTVAPQGDTLFSIAKKYYGTPTNARVQEILQANRDVLPNASALRPGMVLKIP